MRIFLWNFVAALIFCALLAEAASGRNTQETDHDWPQWRGPETNGVSTETGWQSQLPPGGPLVLWASNVGIGYATVSVSQGKLYTAGWSKGQDTVFCLEANSGDERWKYSYPIAQYDNYHDGGPAATPAVDTDRVYTLSREAELFCFHADQGGIFWSKKLMRELDLEMPDWAFSGSPIVRGDTLYVDVGRIIALDKKTGQEIWRSADYGSAYSTTKPFTFRNRQLLAAFPKYGLVILDAMGGREVAKHRWQTKFGVNAATPIVRGDRIFVSSGYGKGCAVLSLGNNGLGIVWENGEMANQMATSVLLDGYVYGFDESRLKCIDLDNGRVMWEHRHLGKGSLMAADGKLIVLSEGGELVVAKASPRGFDPTGRAKVLEGGRCWTVPVLAGGKVYCRSSQGQLVCLDVSE